MTSLKFQGIVGAYRKTIPRRKTGDDQDEVLFDIHLNTS